MQANEFVLSSKELVELADKLPKGGLGTIARVHAAVVMLVGLESINVRQNENPAPVLNLAFSNAKGVLSAALAVVPELDMTHLPENEAGIGIEHTVDLFENAWTTYTTETYEHSVKLVIDRLKSSGFDEDYFRDKTSFDGGCGTGRLALAIAQMGAKRVTAVDLGGASLDYFRKIVQKYQLENIEIVEHDVCNLSPWEDGEYDFVATNGVLHHTENCDKGIREHYRITKQGGIFWVYLYGAGGLYWQIYDTLKPMVLSIPPSELQRVLVTFGLREGLIYTLLDNFLAPRIYYTRDDFLKLLSEEGEYSWRHAKGMSEVDDTEILLNTKYGDMIYGPQGEIRLVVTKS